MNVEIHKYLELNCAYLVQLSSARMTSLYVKVQWMRLLDFRGPKRVEGEVMLGS